MGEKTQMADDRTSKTATTQTSHVPREDLNCNKTREENYILK